jgi:[glutamine synthetase] adenylyltransferase / [glutamine synthetase]-adenylyl-L-tyrosine phosphorylase
VAGALSAQDILRIEPDLTEDHVDDFLARLPDRYFAGLDIATIVQDAERLAGIEPASPYGIDTQDQGGGAINCVVYAFDVPGIFSLITGLLSASGFNIRSGSIYTYARESTEEVSTVRKWGKPRRLVYTRKKPRLIIDRFSGSLRSDTSFSKWRSDFTGHLDRMFGLLPAGGEKPIADARQYVCETVAKTLPGWRLETSKVLYPAEISVDKGVRTRLTILSEDTPFFLFSVSNALALYGFSIESVSIRTLGNRIEDDIEITDADGGPITDETLLNQAKMSVLLTKQFTYFLGTAPDPYAALVRFETISRDLARLPPESSWDPLLSDPGFLRDLSRLLGASDFLWEDFIRLQYETILPLLNPLTRSRYLSRDSGELASTLDRALEAASTIDDRRKILNDFKNREVYLIDLDHIVRPDADLLFLSAKLSSLAEVVVQKAVDLAAVGLRERFGKPLAFAGIEARYAIMGLGKLGGAALGYASDIELLFVYGDRGATDGERSISNAEYFERLFKTAANLIEAKQEGIFHIDLRLRPYGSAGPIACSLESFCQYYGPDGQAHSYEKLALIRMRAVGGDRDLGARIERLRDEMVYRSDSVNIGDLRKLRERQLDELAGRSRLNAKFSPGGLADLEYSVQIIQCRYGTDNQRLRTPRVHVALEELVRAGHMSGAEAGQIVESYHFLRKLINGLRMLRGSAKDLFLPDIESDEYVHLARRTGYLASGGLSAAQQLHMDFETRTAMVRSFIESHRGRESIPGPEGGNVADLVLSASIPKHVAIRILSEGGLTNFDRALHNIDYLKGDGPTRTIFARLAVLAWDVLKNTPDPDMALNNWERFTKALPSKPEHFGQLLAQPLQLEVLLGIFAGSQFLADTLIRNPEFLSWVAQPELINTLRRKEDIRSELDSLSRDSADASTWMRNLRVLRKREILRIGTRDICLLVPFEDIVSEITHLADAMIEATLSRIWGELGAPGSLSSSDFAVFAFGKLGGEELNYSSDIDLLALYDDTAYTESEENPDTLLSRVMERLRSHLADHTESGFAYRVDFRLRPYGRASMLTHSLTSILEYYRAAASTWERQALIRLRAVAGDMEFGRRVVERLRAQLVTEVDPQEITSTIRRLRDAASGKRSRIIRGVDVKSGEGGIRDIEFLVQGQQMIRAFEHPTIIEPNTLRAIEKLVSEDILRSDDGMVLKNDYVYLRRVEHFLQLLDDRQVHAMPSDSSELDSLAKRLEGKKCDGTELSAKVAAILLRVRSIYDSLLPS